MARSSNEEAERVRQVRAYVAGQNARLYADVPGVQDTTDAGTPDPAPPTQALALGGPRLPRPDPSQGARGGGEMTHLQQTAAAQAAGRTQEWLRLINLPLGEAARLGISPQEWWLKYGNQGEATT